MRKRFYTSLFLYYKGQRNGGSSKRSKEGNIQCYGYFLLLGNSCRAAASNTTQQVERKPSCIVKLFSFRYKNLFEPT